VLGLDSNILVRFLTRDDEQQYKQATALLARAEDRSLYLSVLVLIEIYWTLRRAYRRPAPDVLKALGDVVDTRQFTIEDRDLVLRAIELAMSAGVDFADVLIALRNEAAGCSATATFDHDALRIAQMAPVAELLK